MFRVYVDEAGGRHITPRSDSHFVLSAVVVHDSWNDHVRDQFADLKRQLGRHPDHVLHFSQLKRPKRMLAAEGLAGLRIATVTSVIICKQSLIRTPATGGRAYIASADPMYLWALRLLLERVSWFATWKQQQDVIVTFSHVRRLNPAKLHAYRELLEDAPPEKDVRIDWDRFAGHPFRVESPKRVDLLQVADVAASSIYQAVEPGRDGPNYLQAWRKKIYRRNGPITSYGLAVFPKQRANVGGSLHWLRQY